MALTVSVSVTDDLDGGAADETVHFCLDGASYAIDLSTGNAVELRGVLGRYVLRARAQVAARPGTRGSLDTSGRGASGIPAESASRTAIMRAWARDNGFVVSRVGRLPATVQRAYERANADGHHPPGGPSGLTSPGFFPTPPTASDTTTMEHR